MENTTKPTLKALIVTIVGIIAFLGIIIGVQEYTLYSGEEIFLETAPVDPRDLLRGDYVTLRYTFENDAQVENYIIQNNVQDGTVLYISFLKDIENKGTVSGVSEIKPNSGIFIQTKVQEQSWWSSGIETGIGKYFVPQGTGREIESIRGDMTVLAKIDKYGTAKIVDIYYQGEIINPKTFKAP
ncbi:GDYXXLXY domain-containing protein [Candidatus Gracilibacteria bacterium]|nr:GDYXXLXY domain-containing protein [Candidatus Gracilibacteria bacterium]